MSFHLFGGDRLLRRLAPMGGAGCSEALLSDCYDCRPRGGGGCGGCDGGQCVPSPEYANIPGYARGYSGYGARGAYGFPGAYGAHGFPGGGMPFAGYGMPFGGYGGGFMSMLGRGHGFGGALLGGLLGSLAMRFMSRGFGGRGFGFLNRGRGSWGGGGGCDNGGCDSGGGWQNSGDDGSLTMDNIYEQTDRDRRREEDRRRRDDQPSDRQPSDRQPGDRQPDAPPAAQRVVDSVRGVSDGNKERAQSMTDFESRTLSLINDFRRRNGLQDVAFDPRLQLIALEHSQYQNANGLGHNENRYGWETPGRRMQQVGLNGWAENAAYGAISTPEQLVQMWINSPGHRRALLLPDARIAGISKYGSGATLDLV